MEVRQREEGDGHIERGQVWSPGLLKTMGRVFSYSHSGP